MQASLQVTLNKILQGMITLNRTTIKTHLTFNYVRSVHLDLLTCISPTSVCAAVTAPSDMVGVMDDRVFDARHHHTVVQVKW